WQVLEHLRAREKKPTVIVVSAIGCDPHVIERASRAGAVRCLGKPFNFRELLAACEAAAA
ncbi:MAG TPA: DNA-binding response regulator, partial [Vicinamibacteria bacterium]|nr:DNA-binding response regulator [Vicinamibacteria bacterium]